MGATVLTKTAATTFTNSAGSSIFVLFERTREHAAAPTDNTWQCIAIGPYVDVLHQVFQNACACESGSLVYEGGRITPADYIETWRLTMAMAKRQTNATIDLEIDQSLYSGIPAHRADPVLSVLAASGRDDLALALDHGKAQLRLYEDLDIVLALFGRAGVLSPRRALSFDPQANDAESIGTPSAAAGMQAPAQPEVFRIGQAELLVQAQGAAWERWGWDSAALSRFIVDVAYPHELAVPGSASGAIEAFRTICDRAQPLPGNTVVTVTRAVAMLQDWYVHSADSLAQQLELTFDDEPAPETYSFRYEEAVQKQALYYLCSLSPKQVSWAVPPASTAAAANGNGNGNGGGKIVHTAAPAVPSNRH